MYCLKGLFQMGNHIDQVGIVKFVEQNSRYKRESLLQKSRGIFSMTAILQCQQYHHITNLLQSMENLCYVYVSWSSSAPCS